MAFLDNRYLLENETAFALYGEVADLPVIDPHNHADVAQIAKNLKFADPWQLFAATDHYVWEIMRKRGVEEKFITGGETSSLEKWMELARVFPEFVGNPIYEWIHLDLRTLGIEDVLLGPNTGEDIWEQAKAVLAVNSNRPQALLDRMGVEVMCTTDDPLDTLEHHDTINNAMGRKIVRPTWRPDKAVNITSPKWPDYIAALSKRFNAEIDTVSDLVNVLQKSHDFFAGHGTVASDHALVYALDGCASLEDAGSAFKKALDGKALTKQEADAYMSYLLKEIAAMDDKKGWVFQMHIGAVRDMRDSLFRDLGPDSGGDVSDHMVNIVAPLCRFINHFDNSLKIVLYCLEPGHQASLATVARAFGSKVRLGSAWWLNDTPVGMKRQLEYIGSVDLLYNFAGMVSDSRKLLSYSSRFEMFRRVFAGVLSNMVRLGQIPLPLAIKLIKYVSYKGPKEFFGL